MMSGMPVQAHQNVIAQHQLSRKERSSPGSAWKINLQSPCQVSAKPHVLLSLTLALAASFALCTILLSPTQLLMYAVCRSGQDTFIRTQSIRSLPDCSCLPSLTCAYSCELFRLITLSHPRCADVCCCRSGVGLCLSIALQIGSRRSDL